MPKNNISYLKNSSISSAALPEKKRAATIYRRTIGRAESERTLIEQYLPLVRSVLGRIAMHLPNHVDLEELHSVGLIGLLNAIRNFDKKNGATFGTYARIRIRGAIMDELRRMDWFPRPVREKARKVQSLMQQLEQAKGRIPSEEEMASALDLSVNDYLRLLDEIKPATFVSLDAALSTEQLEIDSQYESIPDPSQENPVEGVSRNELAQLILERIKQLPEVQRKVLALYYFEDLRLREIAEAFNLTESRICQIHSQAILAIKSYLKHYESIQY